MAWDHENDGSNPPIPTYCSVAQRVGQPTVNRKGAGSSPAGAACDAGSSNGRTADFESAYGGSSPPPAAFQASVVQSAEHRSPKPRIEVQALALVL